MIADKLVIAIQWRWIFLHMTVLYCCLTLLRCHALISFSIYLSDKGNTGLSILCNHSSTWLPWVDLHVNSLSWHKRKRACLQGFLVFRRPINCGKKYESRSCLVWQFLKCYIGRHSCFLSSSRLKRCRLHIFPYLFSHFLKRKSCPKEFGDKINHCKQVSCLLLKWNIENRMRDTLKRMFMEISPLCNYSNHSFQVAFSNKIRGQVEADVYRDIYRYILSS